MSTNFTIVIPAKNEAESLKSLLPCLRDIYPNIEIIVVDDGSTDETELFCQANKVIHVKHPYSKGNGAAIKTGARHASSKYILFMDADSQHSPDEVSLLVSEIQKGYDMVVGARSSAGQANSWRNLANSFYNSFSSIVVGHTIQDLTSGFRIVDRKMFLSFLHLLPNGFSYPTTITMAFFRSGYNVGYIPINVKKRIGKSHIRIIKDGIRFLLIIFKIATLYSPLKIFVPISFAFFSLGIFRYLYTFLETGHFTNMSALLFSISILIFLLGLISEQVTSLLYSDSSDTA
jgi:glycosyltransferase involved in cell wall biosynthesis